MSECVYVCNIAVIDFDLLKNRGKALTEQEERERERGSDQEKIISACTVVLN